MQVCPSCGRENPAGFLLCGYCGASLTAPVVERRKLATLVFCDMSGSTAMGERVDAETVRGLMLSYFHEMRRALERHGGTVEKFVGDAVLAVFGVPEAHEDDALRACRAALEMQARLAGLNEELERRYATTIALRIGVNTGEVVAGDPASRETFVTGDAVNVAARLEQAAAPGEVLIGESTFRLVRDSVSVEPVEPLSAKGKSEPVQAYRLLEVAGLGPVPRRAVVPLVGREAELALLGREFAAVVAERACRLVTVVGEPGVGKSRLAAELVGRIGSRARAVRGGCLSYGEGITYWALAQIVRELAGIHDEHSAEDAHERLAILLAGAPDAIAVAAQVAQLLGIGEGVTTPEEIAWAAGRFLAAAAAERPLLVLVDDIHWGEPALLELLARLPAGVGDAPVLLVCLARPELNERAPDWEVTVRLEPLGEAELDRLLASLGAPEAVRERLAQAAAGNPLFAEELVAWMGESDVDPDALPTSLSALLGARLDRLDTQARDALERGAIEGEVFHRGAVVELSEPDLRPAVPDRLEALADRDLVRPAAATFIGEAAFRFKHILVREAAYRATAKKLRAALHERFASWLERFAGERLTEYEEILGHHLEQSYRYRAELGPLDDDTRALGERAAGHLVVTSRRAAARGDYHAAATLLQRALELGIADPGRRAHGQFELAMYLGRVGRGGEMPGLVADTLDTAIRLGDRGLAARARVRRASGTLWVAEPDLDELRRIAEEAIATLTELDDQRGLAEAYQFYGQSFVVQGLTAQTIAAYERALEAALASGDQSTARSVMSSTAYTLTLGPMPAVDAIRRCEELIEASPEDRAHVATVNRCMSAFVAMAGRAEEALELADRSGRILDQLDLIGSSFIWREAAADARTYAGDRAGAKRELEAKWSKLESIRRRPSDRQAMIAAYRLAGLHCDDGRWDEAERCLAYGPEVPVSVASWRESALRRAGRARLAAHDGRHAEAATLAHEAVELAEQSDMLNLRAEIWEALAEVQRAAGDDAEADGAVAQALTLYEQRGNIAAATALRAAAKA